MTHKKFHELNLSDAYLFTATPEDTETCRLTLELLLGREIGSVTVHAEHTVLFSRDYRSIRLDIYVQDEENGLYNVEMQAENNGNLPKRSRYHQSEMDVSSLKPGTGFNDLKPNYVIFVCCSNPFGGGLYRYTFTNRCAENGQELNDGAIKMFLNTKGKNPQDVPTELVHFPEYTENSTDECAAKQNDHTIRHIHRRVTAVKQNQEWEQKYMLFDELLQKEYAQELQKGRSEGIQTMILLTQKLIDAGETDKIPMLPDENYFEELCRKYNISFSTVHSVEIFCNHFYSK